MPEVSLVVVAWMKRRMRRGEAWERAVRSQQKRLVTGMHLKARNFLLIFGKVTDLKVVKLRVVEGK